MTDVLVAGDTAPVIEGTIFQKGTTTRQNLSGCTVRFQMRRVNDRRLTVDEVADIVTAASGEVRYVLGANDTAIPGDYGIQWQVVYPDGKKQTTATLIPVTIRRR